MRHSSPDGSLHRNEGRRRSALSVHFYGRADSVSRCELNNLWDLHNRHAIFFAFVGEVVNDLSVCPLENFLVGILA